MSRAGTKKKPSRRDKPAPRLLTPLLWALGIPRIDSSNSQNSEQIEALKRELKDKIGWVDDPVPGIRGLIRVSMPRGVIGVGFGVKRADSCVAVRDAVRIYVRRKLPKSKIPIRLRVPSKINGFPTDVIEVPRLRALQESCGDSVGTKAMTGTIGCIVQDLAGNQYILSADHVLADPAQGQAGIPIYAPSPGDGGSAPPVATLSRFKDIQFGGVTNEFDAAIAQLAAGANISPQLDGIGPIAQGAPNITHGLAVQKSGRSTKVTSGVVDGANEEVGIQYDDGSLGMFVNQIFITGPMAANQAGDSGALVVAASPNPTQAVGLLIGGATGANGLSYGVASPIGPILAYFGVSIV